MACCVWFGLEGSGFNCLCVRWDVGRAGSLILGQSSTSVLVLVVSSDEKLVGTRST